MDWDGLPGLPPRVLAGYSDVTAVLKAVAVRLGWASLFSPMMAHTASTGCSRNCAGPATWMGSRASSPVRSKAVGLPSSSRTSSPNVSAPLAVPVLAWADVGHGESFQTLPLGIAAELNAGQAALRLLDPPLS